MNHARKIDIRLGALFRRLMLAILLFAVTVISFTAVNAADLEAIERRLGEAIADGELSIQEAAHMMEALRHASRHEKQSREHDEVMGHLEQWVKSVAEHLHRAVETGQLKEEDAWKKWQHFKEREFAPKIKAVINQGQLGKEEGMKLWHALEAFEAKARNQNQGKDATKKGISKNKSAAHAKSDQPDWNAIKHKIESAVKAGKMTREQANQYYESIKKKMASRHNATAGAMEQHLKNAHEHLMSVRKDLGAAVEAGKISKPEAEQRFKEVEREMKKHLENIQRKIKEEQGKRN